jgi:hypothetical protein
VAEALEERRDLVQDIGEEAMEDIGLACAIEQGLGSESIPRKEVFAILKEAGTSPATRYTACEEGCGA